MGESYEKDAAVTTAELLRQGTQQLARASESAALDHDPQPLESFRAPVRVD